MPDRGCLRGILFVLHSGIPWEMLPKELGCGSGMTSWRRLRDWQKAGTWDLIHFTLLDWLSRYSQIDWSKAVVDSCSVRAVFGGNRPARTPRIGLSLAGSHGPAFAVTSGKRSTADQMVSGPERQETSPICRFSTNSDSRLAAHVDHRNVPCPASGTIRKLLAGNNYATPVVSSRGTMTFMSPVQHQCRRIRPRHSQPACASQLLEYMGMETSRMYCNNRSRT